MKKIFVLLSLLLPVCSQAQWLDVSADAGYGPYRISAGIKNSNSFCYNVSASFVKLKFIDFGVQFTGISTVTLCSVSSPGVFADVIVHDDKNILTFGAQANYAFYGDVPLGGAYKKDGSVDTVKIKVENTYSYGLRLGFKRKITKHLYANLLISPVYSISPVHFGTVFTNNCAVFYVPLMLGASVRF